MATNTVPTFTNHTGNGTAGPFNIGFNYIDKSEVIVRVNEVLKSTPTHYTFISNTQITFTSGNEPASGLNIEFRRSTNITTAKVDFEDGSVLTEADLDANTNQLLFALQENTDAVNADNLESSNIYLRDGSRPLTGNIVFEGSTKDAHETTLTPIDPTADRTINIPNVSGTLLTTGDTGTVTSPIGVPLQFIGDGSQLTGITFTGIDQFLRRDIDDTASGNITFNKNIFIPNAAGSTNVFNDSDVLDTGNIIFGPTPDTTLSDPMEFNNYIYHSTLNSNTEPATVLQLGTTSSSSTRIGSLQINGNNKVLVTFSKEQGSFFEEKINIPFTNSDGIIFSNHSINNNPKIPSLQIRSNDPDATINDSFIKCTRGNLNIICGVNGNGTVIKDDPGANGTNTIAVFKSDIGNNTGEAFHKGAVELYSEGTKRFETNSTGVKVTGQLDVTGNTRIPNDTGKLQLGDSQDLQIYHDGTDSNIENTTGDLHIRPKTGEEGIKLIPNGGVLLYHDNALKFETNANGWKSEDNVKGIFGTDGDLQIFHSGANSFIKKLSGGTGHLYFDSEGDSDINLRAGNGNTGTNLSIRCHSNAGVDIRYQGSKKLETTNSGITVTGSVTTQDMNMSNLNGTANEIDNTKGSWSIQEGTSDLFIINRVNGKKYKFNLTEIN